MIKESIDGCTPYLVEMTNIFGEAAINFVCHAESPDHAKEQAEDAYPSFFPEIVWELRKVM